MTATAAGTVRDPLAIWCGWVLIIVLALTPLFAWLAPRGFAVLFSLAGLLCLPAVRLTDEDRPTLVTLFALLIWAAVSTIWSPYHPKNPGNSTVLKLALQLPLYWSAICGARRADPALKALALQVMAWGMALLGVVFLVETATGAAIYRWLHGAFYPPIALDRAEVNVAHATFVAAVLWPLATVGAKSGLRMVLSLVTAAGFAAAAHTFWADAPLLAIVLAPLVGLAVYRWPWWGPRVMAGVVAALFLAAPGIVWAVRATGDYPVLQRDVPLSWSMRLGYWSHAIDWISDKPLLGWGVDASRMFAPGIQLHPHDVPLQIWLELGLVGVVMTAVFWGVTLQRLSRPAPSPFAAATAASVAVYLLFAAVNFGIWQEWFLALGAIIVILNALQPADSEPRSAAG
jgi:O-antigen ligase